MKLQSALSLEDSFVLFDLEYTAWPDSMQEGWSKPGEYREIIQIGAVRVEYSTLRETDSYLEFVVPVRNPQLSPFIMELTGITQNDIAEKGVSFEKAQETFAKFLGTQIAYCWGKDGVIWFENCDLHDVKKIIPAGQLKNIKPVLTPLFASVGVDVSGYTSGTLITAFGKEGGRAHDALNDMRNLLAAMREVDERL